MVPTKPFAKAAGPRFAQLGTVRVLDVADASRTAAVAFLEGTATGWGRAELAAWLTGAYRASTTRNPTALAGAGNGDTTISDGTVERVLLRTRERLIDLLAGGACEWSKAGFTTHAVEAGLVVGVTDESGALGYAPLDLPGMRLYDRVSALFVADYLTRPRDYEGLSLCEECSELSFSWAPSHHRHCSTPPVVSGVVARHTGLVAPITSRGLGDDS